MQWSALFRRLAEKGYAGYLSYEAPNPDLWAAAGRGAAAGDAKASTANSPKRFRAERRFRLKVAATRPRQKSGLSQGSNAGSGSDAGLTQNIGPRRLSEPPRRQPLALSPAARWRKASRTPPIRMAGHPGHESPYSHLTDPSLKEPAQAAMDAVRFTYSPAPAAARMGRWEARTNLPIPRSEMAWATDVPRQDACDRRLRHPARGSALPSRLRSGGQPLGGSRAAAVRRQPRRGRHHGRALHLRDGRLYRAEQGAAFAVLRLRRREQRMEAHRAADQPARRHRDVVPRRQGALRRRARRALGRDPRGIRPGDQQMVFTGAATRHARPYRQCGAGRAHAHDRRAQGHVRFQHRAASHLRRAERCLAAEGAATDAAQQGTAPW